MGKHAKVRILSSPLKNPGFPRVFRISGQFLWSSCLSMLVHACRCCVVLCAALPPGESSSESPESSPNLHFPRENMMFCSGGAGFELGCDDCDVLHDGRYPESIRTYREEEIRCKSDRKQITHAPSPRRHDQAPANLVRRSPAQVTSLSRTLTRKQPKVLYISTLQNPLSSCGTPLALCWNAWSDR
jgi:hypothetical protein